MTSEPVARLRDVRHAYGRTLALDVQSLDIPAGCMAGLIGPDGVGKSCLLALVSGVRALQTGGLEVLGGSMADKGHRAEVCPRIAYMPQGLGRNLYLSLSVRENVDYFARLFGQGPEERGERIAELLASTGLAPFADRPAGKLSGGMKQKLGLCCSLIHDPDLLILDEPTTGVDPLSRRQFWRLIQRIRDRRPGLSVLVATAYMEEAQDFHWLAAMDAGRILDTGTPAELLERTGTDDLDQAFIRLLPEDKRRDHKDLVVPPFQDKDGEPAIQARGLTRRFGDFIAVDHVDLDIRRGEIFGFLGSNGCGKTTTMKMLTGLLKPSEGQATLFGRPAKARDLETRKRVGYMTQAFSLYAELSVRLNLQLHARLYGIPEARVQSRVREMLERFDLTGHADDLPRDLPLGIRQRLSLAVAVIHEPEMLILDEPTSGVDPVARDGFWELLVDLSRNQGVTIFVSTHFMNEGERCDRISLMHAGRVLATDSPRALARSRGKDSLEEAFVAYLEEADGEDGQGAETLPAPAPHEHRAQARGFSFRRLWANTLREAREVLRDPVRLAVSMLGSVLLLFVLGYGITLDVEDIKFAVLDNDQSPESRGFIQEIDGSRYFAQQPPLADQAELDQRMKAGDISVAFEIPVDFGRDLHRGRTTTVAVWVNGSMPFRGETIKGYVQALYLLYLNQLSVRATGTDLTSRPVNVAVRYRYNQSFESLNAMVPAVIPLLLIFIPSIMMALGVVREKELGSIYNMYATPVTRLEFLIGKQITYIGLSMVSFFGLAALAVYVFGVELKGSLALLSLAALLFVTASTGIGLLASCFTKSQVTALAVTAVSTLLISISFSGLTSPVSSMEGAGVYIGRLLPVSHFLIISRGLFTKALGLSVLADEFLSLAAYAPVYTILGVLLLRKQEK